MRGWQAHQIKFEFCFLIGLCYIIYYIIGYCCQVLQTWSLGYETGYLSSNYDMIIVYVDARGTMGRGERYDR